MPIRQQLTHSFKEKYRQQDFWLHIFLFAMLAIALWPITQWFARSAHEQSRLLHAVVVLGLATVFLVRFGGIKIIEPLSFSDSARRALFLSYGLLLLSYGGQLIGDAASWLHLLIIPAYCCGLAAGARFVFGPGTVQLTRTVASTLCAFLLMSILMEPLDWPLRTIAGEWSGWVLSNLGNTVELGPMNQPEEPPKLILLVNGHPFHVASECNGFGVILTALLISLLLAVYRKLGSFAILLNLFVGLTMGFAFNVLRIVIIVLLAPSLMDHYLLMHEIVGGLSYWSCLIIIWCFLNGPTQFEGGSETK